MSAVMKTQSGLAPNAKKMLRPSGADKWIPCPGSAYLQSQFPDSTSDAAKEGTVAHWVGEQALLTGRECKTFEGAVHMIKDHGNIEVDEEMCRYVQEYVDFVEEQPGELFVEKQIDFVELEMLPNKGTSDAIRVDWENKHLHIIDLKFGKSPLGKVHAKGNPQLSTYAIGAVRELEHLGDIDTIQMTIHQPRLGWVDSDTLTLAELEKFEIEMVNAANIALSVDEDNLERHLNPGKHCGKYCRAKGSCKVYAEYNLIAIADEFENLEAFVPRAGMLTPNQAGYILEQADAIKKWLDAVKADSFDKLMAGTLIPGWKPVLGRSNRKFTDDAAVLEALKGSRKVKVDEYAPRKVGSPTQLEKLLGKESFAAKLLAFVTKPPGKPTIAPESDSRPSLHAESGFENIDKENSDETK